MLVCLGGKAVSVTGIYCKIYQIKNIDILILRMSIINASALPTQSIPTLSSSGSNSNSNSNSASNSPVDSSSNSVYLDKYHEPSSTEKLHTLEPNFLNKTAKLNMNSNNSNSNGNKTLSLPPISSFDNLIRAAEKQYALGTPNYKNSSVTPIDPRGSSTTAANNNNNNNNSLLSYQLSTENDIHSTTHASHTKSSRSSSSRSILSNTSTTLPSNYSSPQNDSLYINTPTEKEIITTVGFVSKITKPRKKKQCPICLNFYANLSTHKSTHLTPEDRPHRCPICERGFARNNDLIRHKKRHWKDEIVSHSNTTNEDMIKKDNENILSKHDQLKSLHQIKGSFKCPFNSTLIQLDMEIYPYKSKPLNFETSNCHQTGVFSRCDTFKNHLKALHFEYPPGTKKKDRGIVSGRCKHCGDKFENVDIWLNTHVGKTCGFTYH